MHTVNEFGDHIWQRDCNPHRDGGPAIIKADGTELWCQDGKISRLDGPAIIYADGLTVWYVDGVLCNQWKDFQEESGLSDLDMTVLRLKYKTMWSL
jgi:hypothetical protein